MTYSKKNVKVYVMKEALNIIVVPSINGISRIKLNESRTYNALSSKTLKSLINIFQNLNNDNKTKVIIIEGLGKGFSAGHDLKEIRSLKNKLKYQKLFNLCSKLMLEIVEGRKTGYSKSTWSSFCSWLSISCKLRFSN